MGKKLILEEQCDNEMFIRGRKVEIQSKKYWYGYYVFSNVVGRCILCPE